MITIKYQLPNSAVTFITGVLYSELSDKLTVKMRHNIPTDGAADGKMSSCVVNDITTNNKAKNDILLLLIWDVESVHSYNLSCP